MSTQARRLFTLSASVTVPALAHTLAMAHRAPPPAAQQTLAMQSLNSFMPAVAGPEAKGDKLRPGSTSRVFSSARKSPGRTGRGGWHGGGSPKTDLLEHGSDRERIVQRRNKLLRQHNGLLGCQLGIKRGLRKQAGCVDHIPVGPETLTRYNPQSVKKKKKRDRRKENDKQTKKWFVSVKRCGVCSIRI